MHSHHVWRCSMYDKPNESPNLLRITNLLGWIKAKQCHNVWIIHNHPNTWKQCPSYSMELCRIFVKAIRLVLSLVRSWMCYKVRPAIEWARRHLQPSRVLTNTRKTLKIWAQFASRKMGLAIVLSIKMYCISPHSCLMYNQGCPWKLSNGHSLRTQKIGDHNHVWCSTQISRQPQSCWVYPKQNSCAICPTSHVSLLIWFCTLYRQF